MACFTAETGGTPQAHAGEHLLEGEGGVGFSGRFNRVLGGL